MQFESVMCFQIILVSTETDSKWFKQVLKYCLVCKHWKLGMLFLTMKLSGNLNIACFSVISFDYRHMAYSILEFHVLKTCLILLTNCFFDWIKIINFEFEEGQNKNAAHSGDRVGGKCFFYFHFHSVSDYTAAQSRGQRSTERCSSRADRNIGAKHYPYLYTPISHNTGTTWWF